MSHGPLAGIRVLVVEDDDDLREMYGALVAVHGGTAITAGSGNAGWHAFRADRPDVLLSDIQMPDGDGYELVRRVRALPVDEGRLTPGIAVSAAHGPAKSLEAGFHAHLSKPITPRAIVDMVRSFVREEESRSSWMLDTLQPGVAVLTFSGHPTGADMRAAVRSLVGTLEHGPHHVVVDLRQITGFELSVGSVAERTVWHVRGRIDGATIVGGSFLARLVAKAACAALGVACAFADSWG